MTLMSGKDACCERIRGIRAIRDQKPLSCLQSISSEPIPAIGVICGPKAPNIPSFFLSDPIRVIGVIRG